MKFSSSWRLLLLVVPACWPACHSASSATEARKGEGAKNAAIACINSTANSVVQSYNAFTASARLDGSGICQMQTVSAPGLALGFSSLCAEAKDSIADVPALADSTRGYADAHRALHESVGQWLEYHLAEDYRDDECERGRTLHAALVAAYANLFAAERGLRHALVSDQKEWGATLLATGANTTNADLASLHHSIEASLLVSAFSPDQAGRTPNAVALSERFAAYESAYRNLQSAMDSGSARSEKRLGTARDFYAHAKKLMRRVGHKEDVSSQHMDALIVAFNAVVGSV